MHIHRHLNEVSVYDILSEKMHNLTGALVAETIEVELCYPPIVIRFDHDDI